MRIFLKALKEINTTLTQLILFELLMNSTIVFLVSYTIFLILGIQPLHAIEITLFYFGVNFYLKKRRRKILDVEKKYDFLNEKLRTAEDNINTQSPLVDDLQKEVIGDLKRVSSSAFFNQKNTIIKIGVIVVLCFIMLNVYSIEFKPIKITLPEIMPAVDLDFTGAVRFTGTRFVSSRSRQQATIELVELSDNIYGDSSVAILGEKEMIIQLKSVDDEPMVRDQGELEEEEDELFPGVDIHSAEAFQENIPREQQELVKNYFKSVVEG